MSTLKKGIRGDGVKALQRALNKVMNAGLVEDGDFGERTRLAVVAFQKSKGLVADGIAGCKTLEALGVALTADGKDEVSLTYLPISAQITKSINRPIKFLAIHYTAGTSSYAGCVRALRNVFQNGKASADFAVDDKEMAQYNPDVSNYYCWAVGGSKKPGATLHGIATNRNTISIEICSSLKKGYDRKIANHEGWYFTEATLNNAVRLAKFLMRKYNIPIERVIRHYSVTGKICPGVVNWTPTRIYDKNGKPTNKFGDESEWIKFKERLK